MHPDPLHSPSLQVAAHTRPINVVLAYDGSIHAQAAVELAERLFADCARGGRSGMVCNLTVLTVLPTQYFERHEAVQRAQAQIQTHLCERGLPVACVLKAGNPAASINEYAIEHNADLIILGAQGLRATLGILLGGVAQQVVEYADVPVLVVRAARSADIQPDEPSLAPRLKRVLAVSDGSLSSQRALEYLAPPCLAGPTDEDPLRRCSWLPADALISLMHVLPPPMPYDALDRAWMLGPEVLYPMPVEPPDYKALEAEETARGEQLLAESQALFAAAGLGVHTLLERGDAATQILAYTRQHPIDLLVCGSRGLSEVSSWLLGSVSRKLVHYAPCSVLIVK